MPLIDAPLAKPPTSGFVLRNPPSSTAANDDDDDNEEAAGSSPVVSGGDCPLLSDQSHSPTLLATLRLGALSSVACALYRILLTTRDGGSLAPLRVHWPHSPSEDNLLWLLEVASLACLCLASPLYARDALVRRRHTDGAE